MSCAEFCGLYFAWAANGHYLADLKHQLHLVPNTSVGMECHIFKEINHLHCYDCTCI